MSTRCSCSRRKLADVEIAREMAVMYGTGALVEDPDVHAICADEGHAARVAEFHAALRALRNPGVKTNAALLASFEKKAVSISPT